MPTTGCMNSCCYAVPWFKRRWGRSANFVVRVPVPFGRLYWRGDANDKVRATTYRVTAVNSWAPRS